MNATMQIEDLSRVAPCGCIGQIETSAGAPKEIDEGCVLFCHDRPVDEQVVVRREDGSKVAERIADLFQGRRRHVFPRYVDASDGVDE